METWVYMSVGGAIAYRRLLSAIPTGMKNYAGDQSATPSGVEWILAYEIRGCSLSLKPPATFFHPFGIGLSWSEQRK